MSEKCCELVWYGYITGHQPCNARAKVERNGKHYCGRHDPVKIAEKRTARHAAWEAKWKANAERNAHASACLAAIASIGGDPATVTEMVQLLEAIAACDHYTATLPVALWVGLGAVLAKLPENSND